MRENKENVAINNTDSNHFSIQKQSASCRECPKGKTLPQTSGYGKRNSSTTVSPSYFPGTGEYLANKIIPKESAKIEFSRKYNPEASANDDGFMPVPGPYGMKNRLARTNAVKSPSHNSYNSKSNSRDIDEAAKNTRIKSHPHRNFQDFKPAPQDVQRRSQYRGQRAHEELTVKESVMNENILGNGNFEIIRGGVFSDQEANEILGSRRMGRGYGSYVMPTYRQNRHNVVQNVQYPPFYQARVQNPLQPVFYPRAPY